MGENSYEELNLAKKGRFNKIQEMIGFKQVSYQAFEEGLKQATIGSERPAESLEQRGRIQNPSPGH